MTGVAIEQMLELWCVELRQVKADLQSQFAHPSVAASAAAFLDGVLGPERRKTGWMRAEAAGDPGPWRQQAVLGRSHWDADALRDMVRDYALETLASPGAVLVIDETGFLKQGAALVRGGTPVHRVGGQDCQLPDRRVCRLRVGQGLRLHRPPALSAQGLDQQARAPGRGSRARQHPLRHQTARSPPQMIERALAAGVPFEWVATDTDLWCGPWRCSCAGPARVTCWALMPPISSIPGSTRPEVAGTAEQIAQALAPEAWQRLSAGDRHQGAAPV